MDDELTDVFDQAGHLATSAYKEEFFTINHLMLSLLRTKSVTKILGNHVTESAMKTWETELMKSFNDNPFPIRELKYENLMQLLQFEQLFLINSKFFLIFLFWLYLLILVDCFYYKYQFYQ